MLATLEIPSWKDFWGALGLVILYTLPVHLLVKMFPAMEDGNTQSLLSSLAVAAAIYPAAYKLGFRLGAAGAYGARLKAELLPAFKYFILMLALLFVGNHVYTMALAPWDLHWTNTLLLWNDMANNPMVSDGRIGEVLGSPLLLPGYFLIICVFPPLIEEFIMRRWLYVAMRRKMPLAPAILLNGALFGLMHGKDFMGTAMHAFFFCWVYERTGKLQVPILVHAYGNLFALLMIFGGNNL
jgi:membrane protease YdiL (CAAX protease family)